MVLDMGGVYVVGEGVMGVVFYTFTGVSRCHCVTRSAPITIDLQLPKAQAIAKK